MEKVTGLLAGVRMVEGKVKRLMRAMVEIERDVDSVGMRVTATLAFMAG